MNAVSLTLCVCVQFLPGGSVCRSSTDECDLPEYCNGSSSFCQSDVFIQVRFVLYPNINIITGCRAATVTDVLTLCVCPVKNCLRLFHLNTVW